MFADLFHDTETLCILVFMLAALSVYTGGGSFGDSMLVSGLGAITLVPLLALKEIAAASPILAPLCALAFLFLVANMRGFFGTPLYAGIMMCALILLIGG
jgi:hypothetical protein